MPAPTTPDEVIALVRKSGLLEPARLDAYLTTHPTLEGAPAELCARLQADGLLTPFHVEQILKGKHRGFFLGKYKLIDRIGLGGMGQVFLAEHVSMRRWVALKVMPPDRTENPYSRERFLREARAAGQLDHPNLVRAFDVDQDGSVYFLVMEFVDGVSFHDLVSRFGPLTPGRAAHYLWQAAHGLGYLAARGLVHRDVKPANLLVDRQGLVKLLDFGLVRAEDSADDLTRNEGVKILGTADYLAPEQAIDCSTVDVRADVYGLGATAYYLLTGHPPFPVDQVAQKLIAHQVKVAKPVHEIRREVPRELSAVVARMMAKKPADRYQTADELIDALAPWAADAPAAPTDQEIPVVAGAAYALAAGSVSLGGPRTGRGSSVVLPGGSASSSGSAIRYFGDSHPLHTPIGLASPASPTPMPNRPLSHVSHPKPLPTPPGRNGLPPITPPLAPPPARTATRPQAPAPRIEIPAEFRKPRPAPAEPIVTRRSAPSAGGPRWLLWTAFAVALVAGMWGAAVLGGAPIPGASTFQSSSPRGPGR